VSAVELVVVLLAVAIALQLAARRINVPYPALLVLGGLALAFVPGLPRITIAPDTLFLIFVPPLLYWAAITTSLRDFRRQFGSIARFGTLVVLLTMIAVAVVIHALAPEFTWAAAFVLGAIVAPPDPVAAVAVMRPLGAPRAIVTILEGEGLVNDATALVSYQIAVAAVVAGTFSPLRAGAQFLLAGAGGVAVGFAAAWLVTLLRRRFIGPYPILENTLSLLTPFIAYLPADWMHLSGVLSVVTLGLYLGHRGPRIIGAATRVQAEAMWTMVQFILESATFILVGLELPVVIRGLAPDSIGHLIRASAIITATAIVVRLAYTTVAVLILRLAHRRRGDDGPAWNAAAFIGWTGLRGGDSLVIALALPLAVASGRPFPARAPIIFVTFGVILGTLVLQGLTLAPLLRRLRLASDGEEDVEEAHARRVAAEAALHTLDVAAREYGENSLIHDLQLRHRRRLTRWAARDRALHGSDAEHRGLPSGDGAERRATGYRELRSAMIAAERNAIIDLRDRDAISDDVLRRLQRELDLETMMLDSIEDGDEPYEEG
jgi:CPA1 family monovalent cation:H+ antiporter